MKRLDEVESHKDWALTHQLNWGLILTDHDALYTGPIVKFKYEGAMLPLWAHPDQRLACPGNYGKGYRWVSLKKLEPGSIIWFVAADTRHPEPLKTVRITDYDVVHVNHEPMMTVTVMEELSFIAHDVICHRNPEGFKADRSLSPAAAFGNGR